MSCINHKKKFIFIHIAKCAGSSISKSLDGRHLASTKISRKQWKAAGGLTIGGHKTITNFYKNKKILKNPDINLDDYFKWTFVRNPWSRIVSGYFNSLVPPGSTCYGNNIGGFKDYGEWSKYKDKKAPEFKEFIKLLYSRKDEITNITDMEWPGPPGARGKPIPLFDNKIPRIIHYMPALPCLTLNGECKMDFIGKVENLQEDWKHVSNIIGVTDKIGHARKNTSYNQGLNYEDHYDDATINMVGELFKQDIDYFGYEFGK